MPDAKLQLFALTKDPTIRQSLFDVAATGEWQVHVIEEAGRLVSGSGERQEVVDFALLDETATGTAYVPLVHRVRRRFPAMDVMVVGGPKSEEVQHDERENGVDYYFERPVEMKAFAIGLGHRLAISALKHRVGLVGRSRSLEEIVESILQVGPTEVPILIEGESGTGKDVVAQAVHRASRRREGPYVAINCGSLAEGVLESELFGHEKGAFTGAVSQRAGVFERADGGTIFLDEVGEMGANMQVRLLRVLESGEVLRVGGGRSLTVDVRVVAATNRSLAAAVSDGTFRQDLYYRLKGVSLVLAPLRRRRQDLPILIDHFILEANRRHGKSVRGVDPAAMRVLAGYGWPGNIRELRNVIDTSVVLSSGGRISRETIEGQIGDESKGEPTLLPMPLHRTRDEAEREMIYASILALHRDIREILEIVKGTNKGPLADLREVEAGAGTPVHELAAMERMAIADALRRTDGNRRRAAELLGISERTLYRKIKEYGLL